jgi:3-hydroxybutyryl-CoA dehydratase
MKINIGDSASISKTLTDADIHAFAEVTGDHNPLHLDEE